MNVLLLSTSADTAGQHGALRAAMAHERPGWHVDQVARTVRWFGYPRQHPYSPALVANLWRRADVVHLNLSLDGYERFGRGRRARVIVHHHGSEYRRADRRFLHDAACRRVGARQVVSTVDLLGSPGVEWLPVVADLARLARLRAEYRPSPVVRIAHSPSNLAVKGTAILRDAVERLQAEGCPVELDVITGVPWVQCLARKAQADVFVDQFVLGYGLSAVEAWGLSLPVVAGVVDPAVRARMVDTFDGLPFVEATEETLVERLRELVEDAALRQSWAERGHAHAERFHSEQAVIERLEPIYR